MSIGNVLPIDLSRNISHEAILQSVSSPVKQQLPSSTTCPFCHVDTLRVYVSPLDGGRWYSCTACRFKGDSIEFYQRAHDLTDIKDSVLELSARNILPMRKEELTPDVIARYIEAYVQRRKSFDELILESRKQLLNLDTKQLDLLHTYHLWDGYRMGGWDKHLSTYLGMGTVRMMLEAGFQMPHKGFTRFLVIPFCDVPGRVSSLLLLNKNGRRHRIYANPEGTLQDDGLMMLDTLDTHNETVIAIRDPILALHLQRRNRNITEAPMKLVVYDEHTARSWSTVHARKLIYWEHENDVGLYAQAVMHPRAHVATKPGFVEGEVSSYLRRMSVAEVTSRIEKAAKPWGTAMKEFLLGSEFWRVAETLKQLQLSAADIQRIYDACSPPERTRVDQLLGESSTGKYITIGNMRIVESDDGWWIMRGSDRELGCNAIIRLESLVHVIDTDENIYEGTVSVKSEQVGFRVPVSVIEKNAVSWLRELLMKHVGTLKISKSIQPHILEIAKQFHDPAYVRRIGRIGWNVKTESFIFPNFSIKNGTFDESTHALVLDTADDIPAARIYIAEPKDGDWDLLLSNTEEHAAVWAGLAAFMANMLSSIVGTSPKPVAFVGGYGSIANVVGNHLVEELGMVSLTPSKPTDPMYDMPEMSRRHDYPTWLDLSEKNRKSVRYLKATDGGNVMTHLFEFEAEPLSVGESWTFINAPTIMPQRNRLPSLRGAMAYLAWLQTQQFELPPSSSFIQCILSSLGHWALGKLEAVDEEVFVSAAKMLQTVDTVSIERRLIRMIFSLVVGQRVKIEHGSFYDAFTAGSAPQTKSHLIVDDSKQKIFVNLGAIRHVIDRCRLPTADYDTAVRVFASTKSSTGFEPSPDGFVIDQTYWDSEAGKWRKAR